MLTGRLLTESLRVGADLSIPDLRVIRLGRHDVSSSTTPEESGVDAEVERPGGATAAQPQVWTFLDFEAPNERAEELAEALAAALDTVTGWWADFIVGEYHVVVFANRVFRYHIGDQKAETRRSPGDTPPGPRAPAGLGRLALLKRLARTRTPGRDRRLHHHLDVQVAVGSCKTSWPCRFAPTIPP